MIKSLEKSTGEHNFENSLVFIQSKAAMEENRYHLPQLYFWVKSLRVLFWLLVCCSTMVIRAQSMISRSCFFCSVQRLSIVCHGSVSSVLKCSLVYCLAAELEIAALRVVATVCLATQTLHSVHGKSSLNNTFSLLSCFFFVFSTTCSREEIAASVCSERIIAVFAA